MVIKMKENKLVDLSMDFAVKIMKTCEHIKGHYSINNQLERSGTSIGANIREAFYAHSKSDFVSKLQIALKECYETEYWIELLIDGGYYNNKEIQEKCIEIKKMLIASINTAKENMK